MQDLSAGEGRTVLFVSHNLDAVKNLCNYGVIIEKGKATFIGNINDCIEKYKSSYISITAIAKTKSEQYYEIDKSKPFQVEKIEVIDKHGKQRLVYEAQEELKIRLICLSTIPVLDLYGCLVIKTIDGKPLIYCDNRENGQNILNNLVNNKYVIDIIVPAGILSPGDYIITLHFGSGNYPGFYIQNLDDALSFSITDTISIRGNLRKAITSVIAEWSFAQGD